MNMIHKLTGGLLAVALTATASAQTIIYIAGSNGDRRVTNQAIPKLLGGTPTFAGTNSNPLSANFGIWTGGTFNGQPVTIKVAFIGATGGIAATAGSLPVRFLPDGATGGSNPDPTVGTNPNDPHVPTFTMSTNFQSTSPFVGNFQDHFYETLQDTVVAIVGMKWLASKNYPGNNLTTQQAQILYAAGVVPLALFTGNPAHRSQLVYATGRNTDAGQRYGALAESGLGVNAVVKQFKPTITGAAPGVGGFTVGGTVTAHELWPIETWSGVSSQFLGNSGASSGSNLAPYFTATLSANAYKSGSVYPDATGGFYIGYLTTGDADTIAIPNGAVELRWNGIQYSPTAIEEGQYTFWLYTHVMWRNSLSGLSLQFANALVDQITNVDADAAGLFLSSVQVSRTGEGTIVTPDYF